MEIKFKDFNILDIGNTMEMCGIVYAKPYGGGLLILLPNEEYFEEHDLNQLQPTLEEWQQIIRQSDLKETELVGEDKNKKIILRKSTRQIEQSIMWEVFRRDEFRCRYCNTDDVPMTVDHIVLWEEGGPSISKNLLCSCKKCNNTRGNMQYEDWLKSDEYIGRSINLPAGRVHENLSVINNIPDIRKNHMRVHKRSR